MHIALTALFPLQNNTENVKTYLIKNKDTRIQKDAMVKLLGKKNIPLWWPFTSCLCEIQVSCENCESRWLCSKSLKEYPNCTVKCYKESYGGKLCLFPPVLLAKAEELIEESCTGQIPNGDAMTQNETQNYLLPVELEGFQEGTVKSSHPPSLCLFVKDKPLSLSFPPPLLTILFPPFPTLGFLPPDSQEHPPAPDVQDYPRQPQHIPLQLCNLQPGPHTCKCTHSPSHRFPGCIHLAHQAVDSVDGWIRDTKDVLPQSGAASHIAALHGAPSLKPANIGTLQQENVSLLGTQAGLYPSPSLSRVTWQQPPTTSVPSHLPIAAHT